MKMHDYQARDARPRPARDITSTEENMQNLGDIFREDVKDSKVKNKMDQIQEKIEIARPILKTFSFDDTKDETLLKVETLLEVFYSEKQVDKMILDFKDPRRTKLDTEYLIHRMYSTVAFRLDQLDELKNELEEELS